ncbi:MAG: WYL domain-containing protein [Psychromonas sp.]|nr:WYL domain-containing protein [Alteromonadales bacterium]MCP5079626.1 WYL domain-containing protein [Psychromonas sp.]
MDTKHKIFRHIDALLKWEGQYTAADLTEITNIGRTTIQKYITEYKALYPLHCEYCKSAKTNQVLEKFEPQYWTGSITEYQRLVQGKRSCNLTELENICHLTHSKNDQVLRVLNYACRKKLSLEVDYGSLSDASNKDGRIIAPHSIVMDGLRAHVRAYCYKNSEFRDFIIGRFRTLPEVEDKIIEDAKAKHDHKWNTKVEVVICVDPSLSEAQQQNIGMEYQMINGQRSIHTPIALLPYVMKRLRLDGRLHNPEAQQIIIEPNCFRQIKQYLPH